MSIPRLYSASTIVGKFGQRNIAIHWINMCPKIYDFKSLIVDYDDLSDKERTVSEYRIHDLFKISECDHLQKYIWVNHKFDVNFREFSLPIKAKLDSKYLIYPISKLASESIQVDLWNEVNYDLPFGVSGILMPVN